MWLVVICCPIMLSPLYDHYSRSLSRHTQLLAEYTVLTETHHCQSAEMNIRASSVNNCAKAFEIVKNLNPRVQAIIDTLELLQLCGVGGSRCVAIGNALYSAWWTVVSLFCVILCIAAWCAVNVHRTNITNRQLSSLPVDRSGRYIDSDDIPMGCITYSR